MSNSTKTRKLWTLALSAVLAGCGDVTSPGDPPQPAHNLGTALSNVETSTDALIRLLKQAGTAPPLETYHVEFWAVMGRSSRVQVNYVAASAVTDNLPTGDHLTVETRGAPFMDLQIPRNALSRYPDGRRIRRGDSVLIEVTIDPENLMVTLQPHGLTFRRPSPVRLRLSYNGADPDFNGDGKQDDEDELIEWAGLAIFYQPVEGIPWTRLNSITHVAKKYVAVDLGHFSNYAVAW